MIQIQNLEFSFGKRKVLDHLSLVIPQGSVFGILGPNGSGKTTLFRILSTFLSPDSGSIQWLGQDLHQSPDKIRKTLGVVFQYPSLDAHLTVEENCFCQGALYGLGGKELKTRVEERLNRFGVWDRRKDKVKTLSGGLKRRVELAKALLHHPQVLLLDEPSTGLDPRARADLWELLLELNRNQKMTLLVTTHLLEEAEKCSRLAILDQGKVVAEGTPDELKAFAEVGKVFVTSSKPTETAEMIRRRFQVPVVLCGSEIVIDHENPRDFVADLIDAFPEQMHQFAVRPPSLEDVFIKKTGRAFEVKETL